RWPLNINNGYSSSFQEFRSSHFHGGIDLRTFQTTGYPVYAITDGSVYKIKMTKRGAGKGLFFKHSDGNTSIYYHLDRFSKALETISKKVRQQKGKKYFGDYTLKNPLQLKRGQLLAYAGETGAGFAHLHLEIRDKYYYAINPFDRIEIPGRDRVPPVLIGAFFRNTGNTLINGKIGDNYVKFNRTARGRYVSKPVIITGNFDLVLNTRDISDTGRYVSPYSISVSIDEHQYFDLKFERFRWEDNNQLGFVYDMYHSNPSSYYYNLFFQKGFRLESKNISLKKVIESLETGEHTIRIKVQDNFNNASTGVIKFFKCPKPELELTYTKNNNNEIKLVIEKLIAQGADDITLNLRSKTGASIYFGRLKYRSILQKKDFSLKGSFDTVHHLEFKYFKKGVVYFQKQFLLNQKHMGQPGITDIDFDTYINRDTIYIKIKKPEFYCENLQLTVRQGTNTKQIKAESSGSGNIYFRFKPLNHENKVLLHFSIIQAGEKIAEIQEKLFLIYLKEGLKQKIKYEEFGAEFDVRSVYEPRLLKLEEKKFKSSFPVLSRQISLSPYSFPFLDRVYYTFKKDLPNPQQVGIFKYNPRRKKWSYRYTEYDWKSKTYKRKLRSSGTFALMRDTFAPRINFRIPKTKFKKNLKRLVFKLTDKGKGLNDNSLRVSLNGNTVECEYDPDWGTGIVENTGYLKKGKNIIKISVKDYSGNRTSKTYSLNLK
ncbi:MAG: M23 family metallopeptidase, partial [bacterium]|nr:M23 family metallopeptidase [bacterium]